jgi:EAL and modified HD-GYP domain-containing signal transduction protein
MSVNSKTNKIAPLFARQPIFDRENNVIGYELLFRPIEDLDIIDGDLATAQVIMNTFAESTLAVAVDNTNAFINFTDTWLLETPPFGPENVVIEVLESVTATSELLTTVERLHGQGYQIALDDYSCDLGLSSLIPYASIIKVDVLAHPKKEELATLVKELRKYPVKLLAEKVEDHGMFSFCQQLGFDLFQGYFFCKPELVQGNVVQTNRLATLDLLAKLSDPDIEVDEIEHALKKDPILMVKLLKLINSARYAHKQKIDTLNRAIVTLGLESLKRWVTLVVLTGMDDKPSALLSNALIRAKMMEALSASIPNANAGLFFFVGLLSQIDAFFDRPLREVLQSLPIEQWMTAAMLEHKGEAGELLSLLKCVEVGHWEALDKTTLPLSISEVSYAYIESIEWSNAILAEFSAVD